MILVPLTAGDRASIFDTWQKPVDPRVCLLSNSAYCPSRKGIDGYFQPSVKNFSLHKCPGFENGGTYRPASSEPVGHNTIFNGYVKSFFVV